MGSLQMKTLLGRQLDKSKLAAGLPSRQCFITKQGGFLIGLTMLEY